MPHKWRLPNKTSSANACHTSADRFPKANFPVEQLQKRVHKPDGSFGNAPHRNFRKFWLNTQRRTHHLTTGVCLLNCAGWFLSPSGGCNKKLKSRKHAEKQNNSVPNLMLSTGAIILLPINIRNDDCLPIISLEADRLTIGLIKIINK